MGQPTLDQVAAELRACSRVRPVGRIVKVEGGHVEVAGLGAHATIGDRVRLCPDEADPSTGEVVAIDGEHVTVLGDGDLRGLGTRGRVVLLGPDLIAPDDSWIGRVIDPDGRPLDEGPLFAGPVLCGRSSVPPRRQRTGAPSDSVSPRGWRCSTPSCRSCAASASGFSRGSGIGKSTLLAQLAQGVEADVVVIALVGERGREVRHFIDRVLGPRGMRRAVVVAGTSDRSAQSNGGGRLLTAMTGGGKHFRDAGRHVLGLADPVNRVAEAHREVAGRFRRKRQPCGPSTIARPHLIPGLVERTGPRTPKQGDITAVFRVLPWPPRTWTSPWPTLRR